MVVWVCYGFVVGVVDLLLRGFGFVGTRLRFYLFWFDSDFDLCFVVLGFVFRGFILLVLVLPLFVFLIL